MTTCSQCGTAFDVDEARSAHDAEFTGDVEYDDRYDGGLCADCAISETESNMSRGRAILMVNGDEDYDDDFVQQWL